MPSAPIARRRGRAPAAGSTNSRSAPVAASTRPSLLVPRKAIQTEPSGAPRMPYGIERGVGEIQTSALPVAGSSRPKLLLFASVNHTAPRCTIGVCGFLASAGSGNSSIFPERGSSRPSSPVRCAVYQTIPSGATSMPCGPDAGVGVS